MIASQIGSMLGFNVLQYDVAYKGDDVGCICESMIKSENEELIEGGKYLQARENNFTPEIKDARKLHSFQLIEKTFSDFELNDYIENN